MGDGHQMPDAGAALPADMLAELETASGERVLELADGIRALFRAQGDVPPKVEEALKAIEAFAAQREG